MGLVHAATGVGEITGSLVLALISGSDNLLEPKATGAAAFPAFLFLAVRMLAVALDPDSGAGSGPGLRRMES